MFRLSAKMRMRVGCLVCFLAAHYAFASEVVLEYYNTSWSEITRRIPELAEAGYGALWLPPPFKAGGGLSVGYDCYDRFDLGTKNQNGSITTKYGTETDLLNLVEVAHRFGIRVYFDNVMAHNGGPGMKGPPGTLNSIGFVPEDFHLKWLSTTNYTGWGWPDWGDEWQVLNRNPFGMDIAQEDPNTSFGYNENTDYPKWHGLRQTNTEYFLDTDLPITMSGGGITTTVYTFANKEPFLDVGYTNLAALFVSNAVGNSRFDWQDVNTNGQHDAGEPSEPFTDTGIDPGNTNHWTATWGYGNGRYDMGNPDTNEDVNGLLIRALRWFVDLAHPDGFRLDAVKHVPSYFFGKMDEPKNASNAGYCGRAQEQFNITRGYNDWDNHRDTLFNNTMPRNDLMFYGEHLGDPPSKNNYTAAGMRVANDDFLNSVKGNVGGNLNGMDGPYYSVISPGESVVYLMSHDNNYLYGSDREDAHAVLLTREGLPIVYTDGYNESGAPDWFPKPADIPFLGQFNQKYIPNLLEINRHFGWGYQHSRWSDQNFTSWDRYDEDIGDNSNGVTMIFMMTRNYQQDWINKDVSAIFPEGARLFNYSYYDGAFKIKVSGGKLRNMDDSLIYVAPGKYYVFSFRTPEMPSAWGEGRTNEVQPILIYQDGVRAGTVTVNRKDGKNGDPAFDPYGLVDPVTNDYSYSITLPCVTSSSNLSFVARSDGSAENTLMKLDGGIDLNSQLDFVTQVAGTRDNPPGTAKDKFLGYEQMKFMQRIAEKFAARNTTSNNVIGSPGAETFICTIGSTGFTFNTGNGPNLTDGRTLSWFFHDPAQNNQISTNFQFNPPPGLAAGVPVTVWAKVGYAPIAQASWLYYTTNGIDFPEGSAGMGKGNTMVIPLAYDSNGGVDGTSTSQWWKATLPAMPSGTVLRYKIGAYKKNAASLFPGTDNDLDAKRRMETLFAVTNFNAGTIPYYPHNDWGLLDAGLKEGFHMLRTKAFLGRAGGDTSIYRERTQTFYYDTKRPEGHFVNPATDGVALTGQTFGVKVRTDMTVEEVWYRIDDNDPANDDTNTVVGNGNNAWAKAVKGIVPFPLPGQPLEQQWDFNYVLIPTNGSATIKARLREVTSSTNQALTDVAGHFTTLQRTVDTGGNSVHLFVQDPTSDGSTVGVGSNFVAYFTRSLTNGLTSDELLHTFAIDVDGDVLTNTGYFLQFNVTAGEHAIGVLLPNLYNGDPNALHDITVTYVRTGYPSLFAQRQVFAVPNDDSNGDGIPDSWERQWNLPVGSLVATNDDDGDGFLNGQEYIADTDPKEYNDALMIDSLACTGVVASLTFPTSSNRNYFVWYSDALPTDETPWHLATPLTDPIEGTGQTNEFVDVLPNPTGRFFRLEVAIPSP